MHRRQFIRVIGGTAFTATVAPGRFKVKFDGKLLEPEFGAEGDKWGWQYGGEVDAPLFVACAAHAAT